MYATSDAISSGASKRLMSDVGLATEKNSFSNSSSVLPPVLASCATNSSTPRDFVGPGRMLKDGSRRPLQVKEGDKVLFTSWAGDEFKGRSSTDLILLMREEDVLAVID